ncbi:MAG: hypothetical protein WC223_05450 [Bacteroidales bacterium]|jgi:hypothetical protein
MNIIFDILFKLNIFHEFFDDKICNDFIVEPTSACSQLLRNHKSIFKCTENSANIYYEKNESSPAPLISIGNGTTFSFLLKVKNISFYNYSNIQNNTTYYFTNTSNAAGSDGFIELTTDKLIIVPSIYNYIFQSDKSADINLKLINSNGNVVEEKTFAASTAPEPHQFVFSQYTKGLYSVEENGVITSKLYYDESLLGENIFCIIDINFNSDFYTSLKKFKVHFSIKSALWKYYLIITDNGINNDYLSWTLSITDENTSNKILFTPLTDMPADDSNKELLSKKAKKVLCCASTTPVEFREKPKQNIQLSRKVGLEPPEVLIKNLPNPSIDKVKPEMYIYI